MKEISAKEAYELMQRDPNVIYLDVRSIPEFEEGHPIRAINIPLLHLQPGMGMSPNNDFVEVVKATLPQETAIVVGCRSGGRSSQACLVMSELGYQNVTNVRGGFVAATDNFGRVVEPGWSMSGLPVCKDCAPESHYETLSAKAKR